MSVDITNLIIQDIEDKGVIILNHPDKLNCITVPMIKKIYATLKKWETEKLLVIIKGAGDIAFCSGGELKDIVKANDQPLGIKLVKYMYAINNLISTYKIAYMAIIDGVVMGGGAGLSIHGRYRIATERTVFAMPETQIGFFPDNGASYFLPKVSGYLGYYLGLTGHRLKGSAVFMSGLATHYCKSEDLMSLEDSLLKCCNEQQIDTTLNTYHVPENTESLLTSITEKIDYCFSAQTVEEIISRLRKDGSEWAEGTISTLLKCCPLSLKVTLKALQLGKRLSLLDCLNMEDRLAFRFIKYNPNIIEGVRAKLLDKDQNPKWIPQTLSEISEDDVQFYFQSNSLSIIHSKL